MNCRLVCAWLLGANLAAAAASPTDRSMAQSLFEQGKRLMAAGKYAEACPKLEESQRLDPGGGTLLNVALCHERAGKLATAWAAFNEALSVARRDGRQDRIKAAQEHIAALQPKLPWLTLVVSEPAEGQELHLDGAVVGSAAWGSPLSVDPGTHELRARAPGREEWTSTLTISVGEKRTVTVPALEAADAPVAAATSGEASAPHGVRPSSSNPPDEGARDLKGRRTAGWVLGGLGVASLGVGGYFGLQTFAKRDASKDLCPTDDTCSELGVTYNEQAHTNAWISNIGIGVGVVGVALGTYFILSSSSAEPKAALAPRPGWELGAFATPQGGQVQARGRW